MLTRWNALDAAAAAREVLPCCGPRMWAEKLAERRPFVVAEDLLVASDAVWGALPEAAWREAFASHPRIGERQAERQAPTQSLRWSAQEQGAAMSPEAAVMRALADGNERYEEKFGRTFIICALGRSAAEILRALEARMSHDAATELRVAADEQRQITQLRLRRWLEGR